MQQTLSKHYLKQIPAAKDKLTVLLVVVTPALDENSSSHFKTPTFPPVASFLHYHIWGGSSVFFQKRQSLSSHLWSHTLPQCSPMTAAVFSHSQVGDCFRGDPVALVLGWNWTGMEINGRGILPPTAWTVCLSGLWCWWLPPQSSSKVHFLKGNGGYLTDLHWPANLLQSPAHRVFLTFWISLLRRTNAPSQRLPTVTSSHILPSTEWVGCAALLLCSTTWGARLCRTPHAPSNSFNKAGRILLL